MRQLHLRLPPLPQLERSPELAALTILDAALSASEAALLAAYAELYHGNVDGEPRGSAVMRANAVIVHARRLATAVAAYREALHRDARREQRNRERRPF